MLLPGDCSAVRIQGVEGITTSREVFAASKNQIAVGSHLPTYLSILVIRSQLEMPEGLAIAAIDSVKDIIRACVIKDAVRRKRIVGWRAHDLVFPDNRTGLWINSIGISVGIADDHIEIDAMLDWRLSVVGLRRSRSGTETGWMRDAQDEKARDQR